ncbi:Cu(I)-responsive transcriptional regulator [Zobellella taiwanensis]|jgi:MerR family copper efflux transcriptional regulator|uniref:Cu(I)-responsive transcriptional regulator n=1 Tax=Zobellella taiwanensis TaxID=347535 RepID=A0A2P7QIW2_9GAMM|nr:Cu(I)-responsive transcriptional regulator [Zobellella taiwanensis]PSJ37870.1 Cu(I)-responsive transcriptional regulator [Zobellella taiwanensis]
MNISKVARLTGLTAKTIRYYEAIGLISPPLRGANGYRSYDESLLRQIRFVKNAREAGFNLDECQELVALYLNQDRTSAEVKALALAKIADLELRLQKMQKMLLGLQQLADRCHGDSQPDCPIMDALDGTSSCGTVKE